METARVYKPTLPTSNSLLLYKGMLLQLFGFVMVYFVFYLDNCRQNLFWVFCPLDLGVSEFQFLLLVNHFLALRRQFCKHRWHVRNAPCRTYQTSNHCLVAANIARSVHCLAPLLELQILSGPCRFFSSSYFNMKIRLTGKTQVTQLGPSFS